MRGGHSCAWRLKTACCTTGRARGRLSISFLFPTSHRPVCVGGTAQAQLRVGHWIGRKATSCHRRLLHYAALDSWDRSVVFTRCERWQRCWQQRRMLAALPHCSSTAGSRGEWRSPLTLIGSDAHAHEHDAQALGGVGTWHAKPVARRQPPMRTGDHPVDVQLCGVLPVCVAGGVLTLPCTNSFSTPRCDQYRGMQLPVTHAAARSARRRLAVPHNVSCGSGLYSMYAHLRNWSHARLPPCWSQSALTKVVSTQLDTCTHTPGWSRGWQAGCAC